MKTTTTLALAAIALTATNVLAPSNVVAAESLLDKTNQLCFGAFDGDPLEEMGFTSFQMEKEVPFMTDAYEGEIDGQKALLFLGERFGDKACDVNLPKAPTQTYQSVHDELLDMFGVNGTNYDKPNSDLGYLGEIWADTEAMSGPIENLEIEGMKLGSVFVQYTKKPFMQTAGRAGFIISYSTR
ncbi:hypothetical protein [Cohaesibacter sp. ES.047]|uniref:hypothetical protein n=1 Tax=Cohaesibacter sp. ES.047 TaxID=1798205 RepID=UPI000BB6C4A2|nr:hypothetical protein [Cohaesibacter sp. ES.047]